MKTVIYKLLLNAISLVKKVNRHFLPHLWIQGNADHDEGHYNSRIETMLMQLYAICILTQIQQFIVFANNVNKSGYFPICQAFLRN